MVSKLLTCPACHKTINTKGIYHAGFGDEAFLYCDRDSSVLTFNAYDDTYRRLVPDKMPWPPGAGGSLTTQEQNQIEKTLKPCPCGGIFRFQNVPKCPHCGASIANTIDSIHYMVIGKNIDGDKQSIWKSA